MPFVLRQVTPVRLSRRPSSTAADDNNGDDDARQLVTNWTLTACLRQLASLVSLAGDIFDQCQTQAQALNERTLQLRQRLDKVQSAVDALDSRTVEIPEGDLAVFSQHHKTNHFKNTTDAATLLIQSPATAAVSTQHQVPELGLLTKSNRPSTVEKLYERAAPAVETPVFRPDSLDASRWNDADYGRLMALGATLRRQKRRQRATGVLDIETRRPASLSRLRDWLTDDDEGVFDDLASTVGPDNSSNRRYIIDQLQGQKCKLPSPEEKAKAAADQVFTAHVVRLDVTGSGFERMTQFRRSLQHFDYQPPTPVSSSSVVGGADSQHRSSKRHSSSKSGGSGKKRKQKRRNTIACDGDRRDIIQAGALAPASSTAVASGVGATSSSRDHHEGVGDKHGSRSSLRQRLNLVHLLRSSMLTTPTPSSSAAKTSSDISYEESTSIGDVTTGSITLDRTSTSHASSELVVEVTSGHFVTATRTRSGALHNTISRLRRLGTDHTFNPLSTDGGDGAGDNNSSPRQVEAEVHHDVLYELIPCSEKEFGTLGNARLDGLKTVKLRGNKDGTSDGGRSSSGNWSASGGSSCSTRASLAESSSNNNNDKHRSPLLVASSRTNNRLVVHQQQQLMAVAQRSLSPDDVDSVLSGDDCSATSTTASSANGNGSNRRVMMGSDVDVDMETSSVYSCDAEGYYTSFHIDSGLKTLKEGQSEGSLHQQQQQQPVQQRHPSVVVENEYELFGRGSTTTTSSAGTVIYRPEAAGAPAAPPTAAARRSIGSVGRRSSGPPPEPPPRNSSSTNGTTAATAVRNEDESAAALTAAESKEIRDALNQLNVDSTDAPNSRPESCSRERIRVKTQIERIPAMCVVTPPPSDDESVRSASLESHIQSAFLQHVAAPSASINNKTSSIPAAAVRVNVTELASLPEPQETPIVIRAQVVKSPIDGLVALSELDNNDASTPVGGGASSIAGSLSSASNSRSSSRSSSLERKRSGGAGGQRQGARVTLDADGKVVYSSDSLRRRKAHQSHTTFESSSSSPATAQSAFRPNPIGFANPSTTTTPTPHQPVSNKPLSPPPYRPAPSVVRTQPDGQQDVGRSSAGSPAISRSDSYRMANVITAEDKTMTNNDANFQRSDSYRRATAPALRLGPLSPVQLSGHAVVQYGRQLTTVRPVSAAAGPIISGHLIDRPSIVSSSSNVVNKNHMMMNNNNRNNVQYNRQSTSMMMQQQQQQKVVFNPNAARRMYGGPRLLINPKHLSMIHKQQQQQAVASDDADSSGCSLDQHFAVIPSVIGHSPMRKTPVVRPPTTPQDRPSFYNNSASDSTSPLPGYQSLSPPPRLSLLPMASPFQRGDQRYHSLPTRWKPTAAAASGDESPEEGGFLEYNNNNQQERRATVAASVVSSTPVVRRGSNTSSSSSSSCSLDVSFTSSLNETIPASGSWPASPSAHGGQQPKQQQQPIARSVNLVRRTTISDFKRKLLQLNPQQQQQQQRTRVSAVELLKASRPSPSSSSPSSSSIMSPLTKNVALENLIRRSARVSYIASRLSHQQKGVAGSSPRTDVLSSTIIEGRSEEELNEQTTVPATATITGGAGAVRRQLSFQSQQPSNNRSTTPSPSGSSTPIETSL